MHINLLKPIKRIHIHSIQVVYVHMIFMNAKGRGIMIFMNEKGQETRPILPHYNFKRQNSYDNIELLIALETWLKYMLMKPTHLAQLAWGPSLVWYITL